MIVYDLAARPFLRSKTPFQLILALTVSCLLQATVGAGQIQRIAALSGAAGGLLKCSLRAEPKTLNPIFATDISFRTVTSIMNADLLHINRKTDVVEGALAQSWDVTQDGKTYTLHLRRNLRFSDGAPFTADDVLFSFRQALSLAVDRAALVHLVFQDRAYPLDSPVTPASRACTNHRSTAPARDFPRSRALLAAAGFRWQDGALTEQNGDRVKFTLLAPSSNRHRIEVASLLKQDFSAIGIDAQVVSLEFRSMLQRVTQINDYDTAVMALSAGDTHPNGNLSIWLSDGSLHLWNLGQKHPATSWESDIDAAMHQQLFLIPAAERKKAYLDVQEIYQAQLPFTSLLSPLMLGAARSGLTGVSPSAPDSAMLDNIAAYYWKK